MATTGDVSALVDVDGRRIHLECHGSGSPTIVLQSGYGNAADIWHFAQAHGPAVYQAAATISRVCAYDRPGSTVQFSDAGVDLGAPQKARSQEAPMPRTGAQVNRELHDLLHAAGVPGPYVLVGHSLGGLFNLLYVQTYPDEVTGVVFIDATPPAIKRLLPAQFWQGFAGPLAHPPESPVKGYVIEAYDLDVTLANIQSAARPRDIPAAFLFAATVEGAAPDFTQAYKKVLPAIRADFVKRFPSATQQIVPGTTHYIQVERPDIVVDAIRDVVDQSR